MSAPISRPPTSAPKSAAPPRSRPPAPKPASAPPKASPQDKVSKSPELKEEAAKKPDTLKHQLDGLKHNFKVGEKDKPNQLTAHGDPARENNIKVEGGDKGDQLNVRGGDQDDNVQIRGGSGKDQINYTATRGNDQVDIDGGGGGDTLNIRAGEESLSVVGPDGKTMYSRGEGGSRINVSGVDNINVSGADGKSLYSSSSKPEPKPMTEQQKERWKIMQDVQTKIFETPPPSIWPR